MLVVLFGISMLNVFPVLEWTAHASDLGGTFHTSLDSTTLFTRPRQS